METLNAQSSLHLSPLNFLKTALRLLVEDQLQAALQSIDAAIIFSGNSPFYIYQKIRMLYDLGAYRSCSQLIVSQLEYLYKHSSLYILCRSIDYYQRMNNCTQEELENLLRTAHLPYCLAVTYGEILITKEKPFLKRARKAMVQDHYPLCIAYCDLYLKIHPMTTEILYMKAYAYHMLGELQTALSYYKEYLNLNLKDSKSYTYLGSILLELRQPSEALEYFEKASYMDPTNKEYLTYMAECYIALKKYDMAISTYQTIEKYYSTDIQNYFNLSYAYKKVNKKHLSKRYLKKAKKQLKTKY